MANDNQIIFYSGRNEVHRISDVSQSLTINHAGGNTFSYDSNSIDGVEFIHEGDAFVLTVKTPDERVEPTELVSGTARFVRETSREGANVIACNVAYEGNKTVLTFPGATDFTYVVWDFKSPLPPETADDVIDPDIVALRLKVTIRRNPTLSGNPS